MTEANNLGDASESTPDGMQEMVESAPETIAEALPLLPQALSILGIALAAVAMAWLARAVIKPLVRRVVTRTRTDLDAMLLDERVLGRAAWLPSFMIVSAVIRHRDAFSWLVLSDTLGRLMRSVADAVTIIIVAATISALLGAINGIYARTAMARCRPIKGYLQILTIVLYAVALILAIATLTDSNPMVFLTGIGAATAVLLLIFRDTLLSLVASLTIGANDLVRVGDWIEMPKYGADGDVIDIALHNVKVQNWDRTITSVPTYALITDSFKNWRGMQDSGGRRIKRSLMIDLETVRFLSEEELDHLESFIVLSDYIRDKRAALAESNRSLAPGHTHNARRLTNLGTFRAYIDAYLRARGDIRLDMIFLVRQLDPTAQGLPLEIYCFTNTIAWVAYEGIQSDIFDHLLSIIGAFGLRTFQAPSGADIAAAVDSLGGRTGGAPATPAKATKTSKVAQQAKTKRSSGKAASATSGRRAQAGGK